MVQNFVWYNISQYKQTNTIFRPYCIRLFAYIPPRYYAVLFLTGTHDGYQIARPWRQRGGGGGGGGGW